MSALSQDILYLVAEHLQAIPFRFCELSSVNRTFRAVFTSDLVWKRCDPYNSPGGVYESFIQSLQKPIENRVIQLLSHVYFGYPYEYIKERSQKPRATIQDITSNMYLWFQCFMTVPRDSPDLQVLWPRKAMGGKPHLSVLLLKECPEYAQAYASDLTNNECVMHELITTTTSIPRELGSQFTSSVLASDRELCKMAVQNTQVYRNHPYQYFAQEVRCDAEILKLVRHQCPEAILYAMESPTQEFIDEYLPTEDTFVSLIKGKPSLVGRFLPFYNSCQVLMAAITPNEWDPWGSNRDPADIWSLLQPSHLVDNRLVLRALEMNPSGYFDLPQHLQQDKSILLATLRHYIGFELFDSHWTYSKQWFDEILGCPIEDLVQDREVLLALLKHVSNDQTLEQVFSKFQVKQVMDVILADTDDAMDLLKTASFWFSYINVPTTLQVIQTLVDNHQDISMKFCLPNKCLENREILKFGARYFRNIMHAPVKLLDREMILENIQNGGHAFVDRLPGEFHNDSKLLGALVRGGLYGPAYSLLRYQKYFSLEARCDWDILSIFFQEKFSREALAEFRRIQKYPLWDGEDPFRNLMVLLNCAKVRDMVIQDGPRHGVHFHAYSELLSGLRVAINGQPNKRRRTLD